MMVHERFDLDLISEYENRLIGIIDNLYKEYLNILDDDYSDKKNKYDI